MADAYEHGEDASPLEKTSFAASSDFIAVGSRYGVDVFVRGNELGGSPFRPADNLHTYTQKPIIALSNVNPRHLAISSREQVVVYDVHRQYAIATLRGHGRAVSSIAWSEHDSNLIATGYVDGRIAVFNLNSPLRATLIISGTEGVCRRLAWSPTSPGILAACSDDSCVLWRIDPRSSSELCRWRPAGHARQLLWHPSHTGKVLMINDTGAVAILDLSQAIDQTSRLDRDEATDDLFGGIDDIANARAPLVIVRASGSARYAGWIGVRGLLILCEEELHLHNVKHDGLDSSGPLWRVAVAPSTQHFALTVRSNAAYVDLFPAGPVRLMIPSNVIQCLDLAIAADVPFALETTQTAKLEDIAGESEIANMTSGMRPVSIASMRARRAMDSQRVSNDGQAHSRKSPSTPDSRPASAKSNATALTALQTTPGMPSKVQSSRGSGSIRSSHSRPQSSPDSQAMISSLELPRGDEEDSPMPFLSPTIPARRPSPLLLRTNDLATHMKSTNEVRPLPLTFVGDSDSDDENLDSRHDLLKLIDANVPSPRTCGASFTKDGDILCYFPSRQLVIEPQNPSLTIRKRHATRLRPHRLFPSFGNFAYGSVQSDTDSDSEDSTRVSEVASVDIPHIELQPPSFPKLNLMKTKPGSTYTLQRSRLSQHRLDGARELALSCIHYRLVCHGEERLTELCDTNADIAALGGLQDSVMVWRVLSKLFVDLKQANSVVSKGGRLIRTDSGVQLSPGVPALTAPRSLHWTDDVAASAWLVTDIMRWAETQADMSLLASVATTLLKAQARVEQSQRAIDKTGSRNAVRLQTGSVHNPTHRTPASASENAVPILRSSTATSIETRASPRKRISSSQNSSRVTSGPPSPFPESSSITPPFPFPADGRNTSRLSVSGSASPEHHRSSFSATAKAYAQSISEKFSSYGTSPPMKKGSGSPGNELASAMTPGGGSWTKSVSFASTISTARGSVKSQKAIPDDREDEYDSDRTIDDTSYPSTPKSTGGLIVLKAKNVGAFADDISGPAAGSLLSLSMAATAGVWTQHYAEHLRRDERFVEAAQLDNVAQDDRSPSAHHGVTIMPAAAREKRTTCSVCTCKIDSLQQVCARCLHVTHLQCLQIYMQELGSDTFECPSGCGCACQAVPFEETAWEDAELALEAASNVRRKWSLTDPRIWRARMEGESW
ncbi:hypothetical protein B0A48_07556 [Cryoendolithus antarcticus]|uniref:RING-type domain-containing protein n=1 Tax=Cryoendolithus antarcticus TaxID=1507870 RepID=A0A1V8T6L4_9PEZI|nr:hypothetical protein B0A48_07556 [Cryoendolithus antarcticus]